VLQDRYFATCILDEATQAPEPAALVAVAQKVRANRYCMYCLYRVRTASCWYCVHGLILRCLVNAKSACCSQFLYTARMNAVLHVVNLHSI
jgi:hypothetical protein